VPRIISPEVNVGWVGRHFQSRDAQPEREAFPLVSSVRMSRRRIPRIILSLGLLVAASSFAVLADDVADTLLQRGLYFSDLYNWHAARPYFTKSQQMFETAGDKRNALYARLGAIRAGADPAPIPELSYRLDQELAANPLLQSDKELRMFCLIVKGDFDGESDTPAMRRDWTEVVTLARALGNTKWEYRAQGQLGFADFHDGDLPGAQRNVAQALIGATKTGDIGGEIFYLSATAYGLTKQGMNDQSIQYADRAIAIADANPDAGYPIVAHQARLLAMVQAGQIGAAQEELKKLLNRPEAQASEDQLSELNSTASQIARSQGDLPRAIAYLSEALRHAEIIDNKNAIPQFQSELSDLYRLSGNLSQAEVLARRAAESAQALGYIPLIPKLLNVLAQIQVSRKEYEEADQTYDRAATIQDVMIGNANSSLGKTALIKGVGDLYEKHFGLIAEHSGDPIKAFTVVEQARGRVMTDLLMSGDKTSPESLATEKNIARLRLQLTAAHSDKDIEKLRDEIFLAEQFRSVTPEVSILKAREHQVITARQLQDSLSISEALLEYVVDDPASYCLVITRTSMRIVQLPGKQALSSLVITYLNKLKGKERTDDARHLYDVLLGGLPGLQGAKQFIIVRDGQLHLVPFDALVEPSGRYVVESRTVVYVPSATSFFLLRTAANRKSSARGLLAVGGVPYQQSGTKLGDLPSSSDEALNAVAALPNPSNTLLLGNEATETAFKQSVNRRIIHLAVHAIANNSSPDRAALILLSDPQHGEDGSLYPSEIVQLPLDADLVVLSACDTAVGPVEGEEGISTLARAFLLAGARTVVSTLWTIDDDSTLYLMKVFYAELARKKSAPEALRVAKRNMLKKFGPRKAIPYYWAGLSLEGLAPPPIEQ
jgi:CHAT domain-containing protein/cation transport regulator ChaC